MFLKEKSKQLLEMVGDTTQIDPKAIEVDEAVDHVMRVSEPYKLANRAFILMIRSLMLLVLKLGVTTLL